MIILRGSPALSSFRVQKLLSDFQQESLPVKGIYAEFVHVVDLESDLTSEKKSTLEKLLTYGPSLEANDPEGSLFVVAPRPGTITSINVKVGDTVAVGDTVVVLEAMKMQNNIEAENAGTVTSVMVNVGDSVMEGAVLVTIA